MVCKWQGRYCGLYFLDIWGDNVKKMHPLEVMSFKGVSVSNIFA